MIGKMRNRITFEVLSMIDTPGGGTKEEWAKDFSTWTEAIPLRNNRMLQDNQVVLKSGYTFRVRWAKNRDINKERRIKFNGNIYTINSITPWQPKDRNMTLKEYYEITAITSN